MFALAFGGAIAHAASASSEHGLASSPALRDQKPGASEQPLPFKRDEPGGIGTGTAVATAGLLLLLGIWAAAQHRGRQGQGQGGKSRRFGFAWLGRVALPAGERSLRVLESVALTSQARVHVVAWRGKEYLVSTSAENVCVLDSAAAPARENAADPALPAVNGSGK